MNHRTLRSLFLLAPLALVACSKGEPTQEPKQKDTSQEQQPEWQHPTVDANGDSQPGPDDLFGSPRPPMGRSVRRMPLDTLQAAMTKVAGNDVYGNPIEWKVNGKNGFSDAAFGKALGRPDFQASTQENAVSSALYLKFVGDAARDICFQMAKNDQKRDQVDTRTLFPKAPVDGTATDAQKTENAQYLILRFLGLRVETDHPMVEALLTVQATGEANAVAAGAELTPAAEGWRGACVTLFESPLFHND
ncbi:MAG: hypothetical protein IPK82_26130 [Polyangiaceae bacterium]|nr:hypothetical protein [Polyangiaceae bacterium]